MRYDHKGSLDQKDNPLHKLQRATRDELANMVDTLTTKQVLLLVLRALQLIVKGVKK